MIARSKLKNLLGLFVLVALIGASCSELGLTGKNDEATDSAQEVPEQTAETAAGIFDLLDMALSSDNPASGPDPESYPDGYPLGMSVTGSAETAYTISFTDFSPEGSDGPVANGSITIERSWSPGDSEATLRASGTIDMQNYEYSRVELELEASFSTDPTTGEQTSDEPDRTSGSFTVDGRSYSFDAITEAIEQLDAEEEDEEPEPLLITVPGFSVSEDLSNARLMVLFFSSVDESTVDTEDIVAIAAAPVVGDPIETEAYLPIPGGPEENLSVDPGTTVWTPDSGTNYHRFVYVDVTSDGLSTGDYYTRGNGPTFGEYPTTTVPGSAAPYTIQMGEFEQITNEPPTLEIPSVTTYQIGVDGNVHLELTAFDDDGDDISIVITESPSHGSLDIQDGYSVTYTPESGYVGDDAFGLSASDGEEMSRESLRFTVTILPSSGRVVAFQADDEDYVGFGEMAGFMGAGSWTLIERIRLPEDYTVGAIHAGRGSGPSPDEPGTGEVGDFWFEVTDTGGFAATVITAERSLLMGGSPEGGIQPDTWYTLAITYDGENGDITFTVDGETRAGDTLSQAIDDANNTHPFYLGGLPAREDANIGALYKEADAVIGNFAVYNRRLSYEELNAYIGLVDPEDEDLFFVTDIGATGIEDGTGNGRDGTLGGSPEFLQEEPY